MARKKAVEVQEPEVVADGVVRDAKENPILDNDMDKKPRLEGNWVKVTNEELVKLEADGKLLGYDPATKEALIK